MIIVVMNEPLSQDSVSLIRFCEQQMELLEKSRKSIKIWKFFLNGRVNVC